MKSGLRKIAPRNSAPVPMGRRGFYQLPGLASQTGDEALLRTYGTQGTVRSNVGLLASSVAAVDWKLYRKQPQDGRVRYTTNDQGSDQRKEVVKHAALTCLNNPASVQIGPVSMAVWTRASLFELSGIWMECTGKSHWVIDRDPRSPVPLGMWPVGPHRMTPVPDPDNWLKGWIYTSPDGMEKVPLLPTDVIFNRYPDPLDPYGGCGPVGSVLTEIEAVRFATEYNRNFFQNSAEPGGVIEVDHELEDDEFEDLMSHWRDGHRGVGRAHRVAVLEAGQKWVPDDRKLKDMSFVELLSSGGDRIREALAMHKVMTGVTDDVNRANAQTGEEVFSNWQVAPRLRRWRDVLNSQLLPLFGSTADDVEFDFSYPTPQNREQDNAELIAKTQAFAQLVDAGVDPDDAAEVVGLPKMRTIEKPPPGGLPVGTPGAGGAPADPGAGGEAAESAGGGDSAASNVLRWAPFRLDDPRFARVNGHPLVEVR